MPAQVTFCSCKKQNECESEMNRGWAMRYLRLNNCRINWWIARVSAYMRKSTKSIRAASKTCVKGRKVECCFTSYATKPT